MSVDISSIQRQGCLLLHEICTIAAVAVWQKNRELEAEAAASKKKEAGEYDVVVRQLQFEMKAKVSRRCSSFPVIANTQAVMLFWRIALTM